MPAKRYENKVGMSNKPTRNLALLFTVVALQILAVELHVAPYIVPDQHPCFSKRLKTIL